MVSAHSKKKTAAESYGYSKSLENLAKTIGFHHPPLLGKPDARPALRRGAMDSHWEHRKTLENHWKSLGSLRRRPGGPLTA